MTTSMSKAITTYLNKLQQHQVSGNPLHRLAKEVFSPQITKLRRERIKPLYKDETWSADLIDKSSSIKYKNN